MMERTGPSLLHRRKEWAAAPEIVVGIVPAIAYVMMNGANGVVPEEVERQDTGYMYRMTFHHPIHERTDLVGRR